MAPHSKTRLTYAAPKPPHRRHSDTLPAKFSVIVGAGESQQAPVPFCSTEWCSTYAPSYDLNGKSLNGGGVPFTDFYASAFEKSAGRVPVSSAAASSSAFLGSLPLEVPELTEQGCASVAVWTTGAPNGKSFEEASKLREEMFHGRYLSDKTAAAVARSGLQPLIDGSANDITGIANAVAVGATEVLSVQDNDAHNGTNDEGVSAYFADSEGVSAYFADSGAYGQIIFSEPNATFVKDWFKHGMHRIWANSTFLRSIASGTLRCVTAKNPFFGIEAGRVVHLHMLAVETQNITIGFPEQGYSYNSFYDYATLVDDIARTMSAAKNKKTVQGWLRDFFL